jgi:hypothetical protein
MADNIKIGQSVLETITVALYENPIIIFREYVQNSLDAYNKAIDDDGKTKIKDFFVTIDINENNRTIIIKDNGYGIYTDTLFEKEMLSIGGSEKDQDRTKYIGFRGIGRISSLPFCNRLTFRNKAQDSKVINKCIWEGDTYRKILNDNKTIDDLQGIIKKIVKVETDTIGDEKPDDHFFEVTIENYDEEIEDLLNDSKFKDKLTRMLPLKYRDDFKHAKKIINKYKSFMNESLEKFMVDVKYNGEALFKNYTEDYILDSDIQFWEITDMQRESGAVGDKIGLLWFTFARHPKVLKNDEYYGILTRSKNVLMGENDTFAKVADNSNVYITTFREMAQTIRCVYGELLINSANLRDNSRRDWFLPDKHSRYLNAVISDFVKRLYEFRYSASKYFRTNATIDTEEVKKTLDNLVFTGGAKIDSNYFLKKETNKEEPDISSKPTISENDTSFSEQDIPQENKTNKKYYDYLMQIIKEFFIKEKKIESFLKLRAFITNFYKK